MNENAQAVNPMYLCARLNNMAEIKIAKKLNICESRWKKSMKVTMRLVIYFRYSISS